MSDQSSPVLVNPSGSSINMWFSSMEAFWEVPLTEDERAVRLRALERFCAISGDDPEAMIADVLSGEDGSVAMPRVAAYWKMIRSFGQETTKAESLLVMSFFIHNGVLMQAPLDA